MPRLLVASELQPLPLPHPNRPRVPSPSALGPASWPLVADTPVGVGLRSAGGGEGRGRATPPFPEPARLARRSPPRVCRPSQHGSHQWGRRHYHHHLLCRLDPRAAGSVEVAAATAPFPPPSTPGLPPAPRPRPSPARNLYFVM